MTFCKKCVHKTDRKSLMQKFVADSDLSFLNVGLKVVPLSVERGRGGGGTGTLKSLQHRASVRTTQSTPDGGNKSNIKGEWRFRYKGGGGGYRE